MCSVVVGIAFPALGVQKGRLGRFCGFAFLCLALLIPHLFKLL